MHGQPPEVQGKAEYEDGSEPELSGRDAYLRYGAGVQACLAAVGVLLPVSSLIFCSAKVEVGGCGCHRRISVARGDASDGPVTRISGDHQAPGCTAGWREQLNADSALG